jgi:hypothetical protein
MPKTENTNLMNYVVRIDAATPDRFLDIVEQLQPFTEPQSVAQITITCERVTLQGSSTEVRTLLKSVSPTAKPISANAQFQSPQLTPQPGQPTAPRQGGSQNLLTLTLSFTIPTVALTRHGNANPGSSRVDEKLIEIVHAALPAAPRHHDSESMVGSLAELEQKLVTIEQQVSHIAEQLESVRTATEEIERAKTNIRQHRGDAEATIRAIEDARRTVDEIRGRVSAAHDEATKRKVEVVEMAGKVAAFTNEVSSAHASAVNVVKTAVPGLEAQLKTTLEQAKKILEKTEADTSESLKSLRESVASESSNIKRDIEQVSAENEKNRKMISALLGDATVANLFGAFKQRGDALEKTLKLWLAATVVTAGGLVYWAHRVIVEIINIPNVTAIQVLRAAATLPLIGLFWFFIHNYQRTAQLGEHYAFKAAIAASFVHYQQLIESPKVGDSKNGGAFILETVKGLFSPPGIHTELERNELRRLMQLLEKLGVAAITEGADVAKKVLEQKSKVSAAAKHTNKSNGIAEESHE